jgi:GAF domain-containing protein
LNEKWAQAHILKSLGIRSFLAFPVQIDGTIEFVLLAASNSINQGFIPGDEEILQIIARRLPQY